MLLALKRAQLMYEEYASLDKLAGEELSAAPADRSRLPLSSGPGLG